MPRLAERKEDLPLLERHSSRIRGPVQQGNCRLTQRAQMVLASHAWPGNVRELENVIGHACMMTMSDRIDVLDLPEGLRGGSGDAGGSLALPAAEPLATNPPGGILPLEEYEKTLLQRALEVAGGNQSQAARMLRIGRDALRYKMKKHGLQ